MNITSFHQDKDKIHSELNVLNQGVIDAVADSWEHLQTGGIIGLSKETLQAISDLSGASTLALSKAKLPFLTASKKPVDANARLSELPCALRARWASLATAYGMWLRSNWDRYERSMTVVCGSRCKCEQSLPSLSLTDLLGSGERVLMYVSSRLTDSEWMGLIKFEPNTPQWHAQLQYINQKLSASSGCNGCAV